MNHGRLAFDDIRHWYVGGKSSVAEVGEKLAMIGLEFTAATPTMANQVHGTSNAPRAVQTHVIPTHNENPVRGFPDLPRVITHNENPVRGFPDLPRVITSKVDIFGEIPNPHLLSRNMVGTTVWGCLEDVPGRLLFEKFGFPECKLPASGNTTILWSILIDDDVVLLYSRGVHGRVAVEDMRQRHINSILMWHMMVRIKDGKSSVAEVHEKLRIILEIW
jgi:hypothetical protein